MLWHAERLAAAATTLHAALLYRYYWLKLRQLSEAAASEQGEDEAMADDGQLGGGGGLPEPGWGARLQDVAAYLRMLGLEVGDGRQGTRLAGVQFEQVPW